MIRFKKLAIVLLPFTFIIFSCQPKLLKKPTSENAPDSVLFYQKKDLHDPFLDALLAQPHEEVVLKKSLLPPKPKEATFKSVPGFRVQIFASGDSLNASQQQAKVKTLVHHSCSIVKDKGLFKVQVGNFLRRPSADSLKSVLKSLGFRGAWVVATTIRIPATVHHQFSGFVRPKVDSSSTSSPFRIQVFATGDSSKAKNIISDLKQIFNFPCSYEKQGNLFKIFIYGFNTRSQAEAVLQKVKKHGYQDAWIVHQ